MWAAKVRSRCLKIKRAIKSAASAASSINTGEPHGRWGGGRLHCILVISGATLAADLITPLIFKHLEQNFQPQRGTVSVEDMTGPLNRPSAIAEHLVEVLHNRRALLEQASSQALLCFWHLDRRSLEHKPITNSKVVCRDEDVC